MIVGVDHVQITVMPQDVDQARAFYCGLLGLREIAKPESLKVRGGFWLEVGAQQVHVGVEDGVNRRATKAHVAYRVVGMDAWRTRLAGAGIEFLDGTSIPGYDRLELRDPFGNRLELIQAMTPDALPEIPR
jgi:catechol 2,3-dioxygenase-like lactoylglutathione lyase family enzyme